MDDRVQSIEMAMSREPMSIGVSEEAELCRQPCISVVMDNKAVVPNN